jgi:hypothetical protein
MRARKIKFDFRASSASNAASNPERSRVVILGSFRWSEAIYLVLSSRTFVQSRTVSSYRVVRPGASPARGFANPRSPQTGRQVVQVLRNDVVTDEHAALVGV